NTSEPYTRNPDYTGNSVLGILARDDILFTWEMPNNAEVNATLMSVEGRVGSDGLWVDPEGNPVKDSWWARRNLLTEEEFDKELSYDKSGNYRTRPFVKDSLRGTTSTCSSTRRPTSWRSRAPCWQPSSRSSSTATTTKSHPCVSSRARPLRPRAFFCPGPAWTMLGP
ncbi:MAG: hypothetical protein ACYTGK_05365, partial [Planctomycetota bacterium]